MRMSVHLLTARGGKNQFTEIIHVYAFKPSIGFKKSEFQNYSKFGSQCGWFL